MTDRELRLILVAFLGAAVGRGIMWCAEKAIRAGVERRRQRKRRHYRPRQLGTCITGKPACHECMLGDGYCRKEVERHNPD